MAKVSKEPVYPNLGRPGMYRQVVERDGVELQSAAHPHGAKVHANRAVSKKAIIATEVEIDDRIVPRPKAEKREVAKEALAVGEKRGKGRPKSTKPKPWEAEGISKALWYRRRKETK